MATPLRQRTDLNNHVAAGIRADLDRAGIKAISLVGPAGSGKTSLIEAALARLNPTARAAVIVGNLAAARQVERLARHGHQAFSIPTDNLTAAHVRRVVDQLDLSRVDLLFIEADGNAVTPAEFDFGHHIRASVFSVAGGDDKATEFPILVSESDLVLLTKIDLLPFVIFDLEVFSQDISRLKAGVALLQLSVQTHEGIDRWLKWIETQLPARAINRNTPRSLEPFLPRRDS